jgi:hypothetical protein
MAACTAVGEASCCRQSRSDWRTGVLVSAQTSWYIAISVAFVVPGAGDTVQLQSRRARCNCSAAMCVLTRGFSVTANPTSAASWLPPPVISTVIAVASKHASMISVTDVRATAGGMQAISIKSS